MCRLQSVEGQYKVRETKVEREFDLMVLKTFAAMGPTHAYCTPMKTFG